MEKPQSKHLAPQCRELVKECIIDGVRIQLTLTARWGLDLQRHQFGLMLAWARPDGFGGWRKTGYGGASRENMLQFWPEHAAAVDYHGCSLSGPLHYIANTVYFAGKRDCFGWEPGEQRRHKESGLPLWKADTKRVYHVVESLDRPAPLELHYQARVVENPMTWGPNAGLQVGDKQRDADGLHLWYIPGTALETVRSVEQPAPLVFAFEPLLGEGKERELDAARRAAIWPDATDEELSVPREELKAALEARLPLVLTELKLVVERFGMTF